MIRQLRHPRPRDLRFSGLIVLTLLTIGLYLDTGLRTAGHSGNGWRTLDLDALKQRVETGELLDREADWYHPATEEEAHGLGEKP